MKTNSLTKTSIPVPDYKVVTLTEKYRLFECGTKCYLLSDIPSFKRGKEEYFDLNPVGTSEIITIDSKMFN